ncbi:hypothetical protein [Mycolicibacterium sp.]|uniref:hypothetical protein n=1 Tax=Mycolicibacterium sp. TaxID=2320850 RepID=UPI0028AFBF9C|nr:hypothetical protein [Mycolicibacterium sp.]
MTEHQDEFPIVEAAVRSAMNDTYRLGLGAAIQALEIYRTRTTDPDTFDLVLTHLRQISVRVGEEIARDA